MATTVAARDGCAVHTPPLTELVRDFVVAWNRQRPPSGGQFDGPDGREIVTETGAQWLAARTGVSQATIENILYGKYPTIALSVADSIVTALDRPDVLSDGDFPNNAGGTLEIVANPRAPKDLQASCCGGCTRR